MFKRGQLIRHADNGKRGVIIDWGVYNQKYKRYMLAKRDSAECIRVWTSTAIEVWPISSARPESEKT